MKWLAFLAFIESGVAFLKGHLGPISVLGLALLLCFLGVLAVYLPASHYRVTPVVMLGLVAFFSGFFGAKALDRP